MAYQPIMMKDVDLVLGDEATAVNFACQVRTVKLTPNASVEKMKTLCPAGRYADVDDPEWDLEIGYAYGRDNGVEPAVTILADFLLSNHGTKVPFVFRPRAGGVGYRGEVTLLSGEIGGSQGSWMESSVTLPVTGQPERVAAL